MNLIILRNVIDNDLMVPHLPSKGGA
jgi:hypothetical protein